MEPYQNRTDTPFVYTGTDRTDPHRTASRARAGPPRKNVLHGTEPKRSRVNTRNGSRQVREESRQGEIRLTVTDDNSIICSRRKFLVWFRRTSVCWETFSRTFLVPSEWRERLSFGTVHA